MDRLQRSMLSGGEMNAKASIDNPLNLIIWTIAGVALFFVLYKIFYGLINIEMPAEQKLIENIEEKIGVLQKTSCTSHIIDLDDVSVAVFSANDAQQGCYKSSPCLCIKVGGRKTECRNINTVSNTCNGESICYPETIGIVKLKNRLLNMCVENGRLSYYS